MAVRERAHRAVDLLVLWVPEVGLHPARNLREHRLRLVHETPARLDLDELPGLRAEDAVGVAQLEQQLMRPQRLVSL